MRKDQFRKFGHEFVDWIADYFESIEELPVCSGAQPGSIRDRLPPRPPLEGEAMEQIFEDFKELIVPGMTHWQHPSWFAYFPANNSPPSILAEMLTAGLGAQCMSWQTSPAATELEELVMEWLRGMLGLPEGMEGVIQDTASTATLCALLAARERAQRNRAQDDSPGAALVVYASEEAHSSVEKGARIAGFDLKYLRKVSTDAQFALSAADLEEQLKKDIKAGLTPACVVATVGTTSSTAVDPLDQVGPLCRRYGPWLHVDAAYAGTAAILPEKRWILKGVEYADSFVVNPHKWMFTNFDCSALFVKRAEDLISMFRMQPEYLKTDQNRPVKNYRDWGIPLGRRFRALKLWFVIRNYGVEGLRGMVREHIRLAQVFKEGIEKLEHFELMAPVHFGLVCFRLNDGRSSGELEGLNQTFLEALNSSERLFLTHTKLKGSYVLRMAIGSRLTKERHVTDAMNLMARTSAGILGGPSVGAGA